MKRLLIFIALFSIGSGVFAQDPDPDLIGTWYLQEIFYNPSGLTYYVNEIEPAIFPYITISENLDFEGQGACNTFDGSYTLSQGMMTTDNFNNTTTNCDFPIHNNFENDYFTFMSEGWLYAIDNDGTGLRLTAYQPIDPFAIFTNYPLSVSDIETSNIKIYPNPSSSIIHISSQRNPLLSIEVFNLLGENILTRNTDLETVDISHLDTGIYLLKMYTERGATVKKIIKN